MYLQRGADVSIDALRDSIRVKISAGMTIHVFCFAYMIFLWKKRFELKIRDHCERLQRRNNKREPQVRIDEKSDASVTDVAD